MAITYIPPVIATGTMTRRQYLAYFQALIADQSNMLVDTFQARMWLNMAVMKAAGLVRKAQPEVYRTLWQATLDLTTLRPTLGTPDQNWYYIDLRAPFVQGAYSVIQGEQNYPTGPSTIGMIPFQYIATIERIAINRDYPNSLAPSVSLWQGTTHKLDYDIFSAILTGLNDQYRQDVVWTVQNNELSFYKGPEVAGGSQWTFDPKADIMIQRKPLLDDLKEPWLGTSNFDSPMDCPEEIMPLVMEYGRQQALQSLGKPTDPSIPQITQALEQSYLMSVGNYDPSTQQ